MSWLAALATLLMFLESWFAFSTPQRFAARRASGAYGVITVFLPLQGPLAVLEKVVQSILAQSYPFIELVLIRSEGDAQYTNFVRDMQAKRTHISIRECVTALPMDTEVGRIRALDQAQAGAHGRWWVVLRPDVLLDRFAVESAVEFSGSNDIAALSLCPGMQCTSVIDRMIAPSMEYLAQVTVVSRNRKKTERLATIMPAFFLLNRETFEAVSRMNRMPGILNEAGWNLWSYQVEGLRTFEGDGSLWMWREARVTSWASSNEAVRKYGMREAGLVAVNALLAVVAVGGVALGLTRHIDGFSGASILAFSAISYALMAISYFLYARRLRAMEWLAPVWFIPHLSAAVLTLLDIRGRIHRRRAAAETQAASTVSRSSR